MLQFVHVFCLIAVICAAPLDQERKNNQLIEKEPIPAKKSDREYEVMSLEPSELLVPTAVEQKRSSELQDAILNPKDKRGIRRKGNRRRNWKGRTRGRKSRKGKGRRKNKNKINQKQQGKSKSRAGENEEDESPTYTTQQVSKVEWAELGTSPPAKATEGLQPLTKAMPPLIPLAFPKLVQLIPNLITGSDSGEAKVMAAPAAQSLPLVLPNSDSGAASALIAPAAIQSASPTPTEAGGLNPTTQTDQTTTPYVDKCPNCVGIAYHYAQYIPPPPPIYHVQIYHVPIYHD